MGGKMLEGKPTPQVRGTRPLEEKERACMAKFGGNLSLRNWRCFQDLPIDSVFDWPLNVQGNCGRQGAGTSERNGFFEVFFVILVLVPHFPILLPHQVPQKEEIRCFLNQFFIVS